MGGWEDGSYGKASRKVHDAVFVAIDVGIRGMHTTAAGVALQDVSK